MARYDRRPAGPRRPNGPWQHGTVPVIGLIGGIGAGKSTVAAELARRGAHVVDADTVGHALLQQRPIREQVLHRFGPDVLDTCSPSPEGFAPIDRKALGALVFSSASARKDLERILHPAMRRTFVRAIERAQRRGDSNALVIDAAILLEAGWDDLCDRILFVDAPEPLRLERLAESRGWNADQLNAREQAQWPLESKRQRADFVLSNDSTPEDLQSAIGLLWEKMVRRPPSRSRSITQQDPTGSSTTTLQDQALGQSRGPRKAGRTR